MIDLNQEQAISLRQVPGILPTVNGIAGMVRRKPVHWRTVFNWSRYGKRGVVLETTYLGVTLVTSKEALGRFFERLSMSRMQRVTVREQEAQRRQSVRSRSKSHRQAMDDLDRLGL